MEHQNFLVCDKYEQSYSFLKSIENPDFPRSKAPIVCQIQDFDEKLSKEVRKVKVLCIFFHTFIFEAGR